MLTDFRLYGRPVTIGPHSPLDKSISYTSTHRLSHSENEFSLESSALSFINSGTNRYRYKLEGLDSPWQEVSSNQRRVTYTTLPAGKYTFRGQGATSRGVWSEPGAVLRIEILPAWWRTWWFTTICAATAMLMAFSAYSYRTHQIALQFELRPDERVSERTRIARDLHDTLLQSFHGLLLRFQTVSMLLPARAMEAREQLESAIDQAAQAITEGRDAVQNLRLSVTLTNDLAAAIGALGQSLAAHENGDNTPAFRIAVEGATRELHPLLRDEVYRIGVEALRNAFRHAQARHVEVEIHYGALELRLHVRDDAKGMDAKILKGQSPAGHFGMYGMRERAESVGGRLEVCSAVDSGTQVQLTIPASIAYNNSPPSRRPWLGMRK